MGTSACSAPGCDQPPHNGYLCGRCRATLRRDLESVPDLITDLDVTIARLDRLTDPSGRQGDEDPLPLRLGPMEARRELTMRLAGWVTYLTAEHRFLPDRGRVAMDAKGTLVVEHGGQYAGELAAYLLDRIDDLARDEAAGTCADEVGYVVITARRAVDKPTHRAQFYVGPCPEPLGDAVCPGGVWAFIPASDVKPALLRCQNCAASWTTVQWLQVGRRILRRIDALRSA